MWNILLNFMGKKDPLYLSRLKNCLETFYPGGDLHVEGNVEAVRESKIKQIELQSEEKCFDKDLWKVLPSVQD